ncbi:four-carbon acid sugar kinase family protein [Dermabacteraceae bacterium P13136]
MPSALSELLVDFPADVRVPAEEVQKTHMLSKPPILVVLDDDPTGTQSVADLPVLMTWQPEDFAWAYQTGKPAVYVMTNTRSLSPEDARRVNREVVSSAYSAAKQFPGLEVLFISRSDSTLRGHFPLEPYTLADAVKEETGADIDGIIISPAFADAGRITVNAVHYAGSEAAGFTPVGETEFAADATFGYENSRLPEWVEEKTDGSVKAADVVVIDLATLRTSREETVSLLRSAHNRQPVVCDAVTEDDLRLLSLALIEAETAGSRFLYRVGPPFVRARIGQEAHPPLTPEEVSTSRQGAEPTVGGLIMMGSHVALTTRQLENLRNEQSPTELEINVQTVLSDGRDAHVSELVETAVSALDSGNVVVRTSRVLVKGEDGDSSLDISRRVSEAVVAVTRGVLAKCRPRFVVAKGGITSSDVAAKGLQIRHARVIGPMLPGIVSLWSGENEPAKGIPYIVFAGNVGDETSLTKVVAKLSQ